jgi:hypothetical protein
MDMDRSILGKEFDRTDTEPVTADELIAFARSLGERDPRYVTPGADLVAHPTYCVRYRGRKFFPDNLPAALVQRASLDAGKDIELGAAIRPGDRIRVVSSVHDLYEKTGRSGTMTFVVVRFVLTNQRDEHVATIDNRMMYR